MRSNGWKALQEGMRSRMLEVGLSLQGSRTVSAVECDDRPESSKSQRLEDIYSDDSAEDDESGENLCKFIHSYLLSFK